MCWWDGGCARSLWDGGGGLCISISLAHVASLEWLAVVTRGFKGVVSHRVALYVLGGSPGPVVQHFRGSLKTLHGTLCGPARCIACITPPPYFSVLVLPDKSRSTGFTVVFAPIVVHARAVRCFSSKMSLMKICPNVYLHSLKHTTMRPGACGGGRG